MKKTPSQHEKGLYGYSLETLIKLRNDLEAAFIAGKLERERDEAREKLTAWKEARND